MIPYSPACEEKKKNKHSAQLSALTGKGFGVYFSNGIYTFLVRSALGNDSIATVQAVKAAFDE